MSRDAPRFFEGPLAGVHSARFASRCSCRERLPEAALSVRTGRFGPSSACRAILRRAWRSAGIRHVLGLPGWLALVVMVCAGCDEAGPGADRAAEAQIRERIETIREAIRVKSAAGIVRWGTPDWNFTGADGKTYDRAAYLQRTEGLFARIEKVESLETAVERVKVTGATAEVELTQTMIRRERGAEAAAGKSVRLWLRYRERQTWIRAGESDWRVQRVEFIGTPERKELPADAAVR